MPPILQATAFQAKRYPNHPAIDFGPNPFILALQLSKAELNMMHVHAPLTHSGKPMFNNPTMKRSLNLQVNVFIQAAPKWQAEMHALRRLLLDCQLTEEFKWGKPCYTFLDANVIVLQPLKAYCALLFCKGMLLKDPHGILVKTGPNTRVGRQVRFTGVAEVLAGETPLKACIAEAMALEKAGLRVPEPAKTELQLPVEFQTHLAQNPALKTAFAALTPGRQRAYGFFFAAAKQAQTRESRIAKCVPQILQGRGLND